MKKFILKFSLAASILLLLIGMFEFYARSKDKSTNFYKKKFLIENRNEIEGIILGPSHIMRAVLPKYSDFNLASMAQGGGSSNIDFFLLEYVLEEIQPKFILLDLSLGYLLKSRSQTWIEANKLPYYYKNIDAKFIKKWMFIDVPFKNYLKDDLYPDCDKWGIALEPNQNVFEELGYNENLIINHRLVKRKLRKHNSARKKQGRKTNEAFYKIIRKCRAKNIKLVLVSPPKHYIYNENIDKDYISEREEFLKEVLDNKNVFFLNYETFNEKKTKYFFNLNHVNEKGAKALSIELNRALSEILNEENN